MVLCASVYQAIIGSDNGLLPVQHQAIIWTNEVLLSIILSGTNFIFIQEYAFGNVCEMAGIFSWSQCVNIDFHHHWWKLDLWRVLTAHEKSLKFRSASKSWSKNIRYSENLLKSKNRGKIITFWISHSEKQQHWIKLYTIQQIKQTTFCLIFFKTSNQWVCT